MKTLTLKTLAIVVWGSLASYAMADATTEPVAKPQTTQVQTGESNKPVIEEKQQVEKKAEDKTTITSPKNAAIEKNQSESANKVEQDDDEAEVKVKTRGLLCPPDCD